MIHYLYKQLKLTNTPKLIRRQLPDALWQVDTSKKEVYLTFDDGPTPGVTEDVLEMLAAYGAKATFFCIGDNVRRHPELYQKLQLAGHAVGNHTFHHISGWQNGNEVYEHNIALCAKEVKSSLFRPPYGQITPQQVQRLQKQYTIVMWSALSWDFDHDTSPRQCAKNVIKNIQNGSIVVFHDSKKAAQNCLPALEQVLHFLTEHQYSCLPLLENKHP